MQGALKKFLERGDAAALILALAVLASVLASGQWHSLAYKQPSLSISLQEYDFLVGEENPACFSIAISAEGGEASGDFTVEVSQGTTLPKIALREKLKTGTESFRRCVPAKSLGVGKNFVKASYRDKSVHFSVEKQLQALTSGTFKVENVAVEGNTVSFSVKSESGLGSARKAVVKVNGSIQHSVLAYLKPSESKEFREKITLQPGDNLVEVSVEGTASSARAAKQEEGKIGKLAGIVLFTLLLSGFVLSQGSGAGNAARGLALLSLTLALAPLALHYAGARLETSTVLVAAIAVLAALFVSKRKTAGTEKESNWLLLVPVLLLAAAHYHQFVLSTHWNYWNVFYERYTDLVLEAGKIPSADPLSYYGRNFSFAYGYFLFNSSLSLITGLQGSELFALSLAIADLLLAFSLLYLAAVLKLNSRQSLLFLVLAIGAEFTFVNFVMSPKQNLALGLMVFAIAFLLENFQAMRAVLGGAAGFVQASVGVAFPLMAFALSRERKNAGEWAFVAVVSLAAFALLSLPILLTAGKPSEAKPNEWGYLVELPGITTLKDAAGSLWWLLLACLLLGAWKWKTLGEWEKKLLAFTIAGLGVQNLVTFRANVFTSIIAGVFIPVLLEKRLKDDRIFCALILLGVVGLSGWSWSYNFKDLVAAGQVLEAEKFAALNTSTSSNFIVEPNYGHVTTYLGQRKVLADLYVEFADEEKLDDAFEFMQSSDPAILEKWDVDYVLLNAWATVLKVNQTLVFTERKELKFLDKVYSNGDVDVYFVPSNA